MIFGDPPAFGTIMEVLTALEQEINQQRTSEVHE